MDVDIAVPGGGPGGPGGNAATIRAAQLGARVACIDRAPELGETCLRIGCVPTKAWAQTALALKQVEKTFGKLGVQVGGSHLDFPAANEWKTAAATARDRHGRSERHRDRRWSDRRDHCPRDGASPPRCQRRSREPDSSPSAGRSTSQQQTNSRHGQSGDLNWPGSSQARRCRRCGSRAGPTARPS
jgi:hypothetical protein